MKKCFALIVVMLCCGVTVHAQKPDMKGAVDKLNVIIELLRENSTKVDSIFRSNKEKLDRAISRNKNFSPSNGEEGIKRLLNDYDDLEKLLSNPDLKVKLEKYTNSALAQTYVQLFIIRESLTVAYDEQTNEAYKKELSSLKGQVLKPHEEGFEALTVKIEDFRFAVSELLRVFKLVDKMGADPQILNKLLKYGELEYIDNADFTEDKIRDYIDSSPANRDKIKKEIEELMR